MITLYYNHDKPTVGLYFVYFDYFSNQLHSRVDSGATQQIFDLRSTATEDLHSIYYKVIQQ